MTKEVTKDINQIIEECENKHGELGEDFALVQVKNGKDKVLFGFKSPDLGRTKLYKDKLANEFSKASLGGKNKAQDLGLFNINKSYVETCLILDDENLGDYKKWQEVTQLAPRAIDDALSAIEELVEQTSVIIKKN